MLSGPPYELKHRLGPTVFGFPLSIALFSLLVLDDDPAFSLPPSGTWFSLIWFGALVYAAMGSLLVALRPAVEIDRHEIRVRHGPILTVSVPITDVTDLRLRREYNSFLLRVQTDHVETDVKIRLPRGADWMAVERQLRTFVGLVDAAGSSREFGGGAGVFTTPDDFE